MPDIFELYTIPLDDWITAVIRDWLVVNFRGFFVAVGMPVARTLRAIDGALQFIPPVFFLLALVPIAWRLAGPLVAVFAVLGMLFVGFLGLWDLTMTTLSMVLTAVIFCTVAGVPLGILAARSDSVQDILRPFLDAMQTVPSFVYLVPVVMLFGTGPVPGIMATIIFALPPIIRLTNLGIRQVQREVVEAAFAFGSTSAQVLREVQLPLAMRTIMAGLNQTLMLAMAMVVIAALINAGGLGQMVLRGLGRLDVGLAAVGGIGIVVLAMVLDRITQGLMKPRGA